MRFTQNEGLPLFPKLQNPIKLIDEKIDNNKLHFIKLKGENNEKIINN